MNDKVVIFGTGFYGRAALRKCRENKRFKCVCFIDSDKKKDNTTILKKKIHHVNKINKINFDKIIFCGRYIEEQLEQVKKYNIKKNIIKNLLSTKSLHKSSYKIIFSTNFGRDIEYYTGMVFEISTSKNKQEIARGGRYDDLLKNLGSKKNISAVGAAINLNNLSGILK